MGNMVTNVYIKLNLVRARHPMGWRYGFRRKLFGNLHSYAYNCQRNKNVAQRLYW